MRDNTNKVESGLWCERTRHWVLSQKYIRISERQSHGGAYEGEVADAGLMQDVFIRAGRGLILARLCKELSLHYVTLFAFGRRPYPECKVLTHNQGQVH